YPTMFNFADWDGWAKTKSVNKNVRVYIGVPGAPSAASSGYIDGPALATIYNAVRSNYTSLGGIMTWDVSQARTSGLATSIRATLNAASRCSGSSGSGGGSGGGSNGSDLESVASTTAGGASLSVTVLNLAVALSMTGILSYAMF
ncbi:Chitinase 2, partial [Coemansia nantahalensis]